jgi:hypothetical protein
MRDSGTSLMGIGVSSGENRAVEAARAAINSPLLELSIDGAQGVLFNVSGGPDITMIEINEAASVITESIDPNAKVIFGAVMDENMKKGEIQITVVATGFDGKKQEDEQAVNYYAQTIESVQKQESAQETDERAAADDLETRQNTQHSDVSSGPSSQQRSSQYAQQDESDQLDQTYQNYDREGIDKQEYEYQSDLYEEYEDEPQDRISHEKVQTQEKNSQKKRQKNSKRSYEQDQDEEDHIDTTEVDTQEDDYTIPLDAEELEVPTFVRRRMKK